MKESRTNRGLLALAFMLSVASFACDMEKADSGSTTGSISSAMGLGFGGGDDDKLSQEPAPVVTPLGEFDMAQMKSPDRIAAGPAGLIVVTDPRARAVHVLTANGAWKGSVGAFAGPLGCAVDQNGRVYVGDRVTGSVQVFNATGVPVGMLGTGVGEFLMPNDLALDAADGTVWVVDSKADRVAVYGTDDLALKFYAGGPGNGDGELRFPTGIALDAGAGKAYVADHGNARIQVFDRTGVWLESFGEYGGDVAEFTRPQGIAMDSAGRLYVADAFQGRIQVLDTQGLHIAWLGEYGLGPGELALPSDVVIDGYGRLLVTSYRTGKIVLFGIDDYSDPPPDVEEGPPPPVVIRVFLDKKKLKKARKMGRKKLKVYLEAPDGTAGHIAPDTVLLNGEVAPIPGKVKLGDRDKNGVPDLRLKFSRAEVVAAAGVGLQTLSVTGEFDSGQAFEGFVEIEVFVKGKGWPWKF